MRLLKEDLKNKEFFILVESLDDLWQLQHFIEKQDIVSAYSTRSFKPKNSEKTERKKVFVELSVEKLEFHEPSGQLRVSGRIVSGRPEKFVELKAFHSIELEPGRKAGIKKERVSKFQLERLKKISALSKKPKTLLVVLDDEEATLALLSGTGFQIKATIKALKQGKRYQTIKTLDYFNQLLKKIKELELPVIIAGPGFTKQNFREFLSEKNLNLPLFVESVNSVGITGINELLKKGIALKAIQQSEIAKESLLVEELLKELGKNFGLVAYGLKEVQGAVNAGAVLKLLVEEAFFLENREKISELLEKTEKLNGEVHIINSKHAPGQQLAGIGGIAALLRYKT